MTSISVVPLMHSSLIKPTFYLLYQNYSNVIKSNRTYKSLILLKIKQLKMYALNFFVYSHIYAFRLKLKAPNNTNVSFGGSTSTKLNLGGKERQSRISSKPYQHARIKLVEVRRATRVCHVFN